MPVFSGLFVYVYNF